MAAFPKRLSFEFFPPKTFDGMKSLIKSAGSLQTFSPEFFSVTFGAGGSTRQRTIETVQTLQQKLTTPIAPHISCIGFDRNELINILDHYKEIGTKRIIVLRGDIPSGMGSRGDFKFASEFVKFIRVVYGNYFKIEVAAYPECHPQAKNFQQDLSNLKDKMEAGADSAITQYFFNPDAYFYFLEDCVRQGITLPVYPGIMPIYQFDKLVNFSDVCGAEIPRWLYKKLESYGDDAESFHAFSLEFISKLCERLLAGGAPGLHFYTLNQSEFCQGIFDYIGSLEKVSLIS